MESINCWGIDTTNSLTHAVAHEGTAYAVASIGEYRSQFTGWISEGLRLPTAVAEASAGPGGLYAGANASLIHADVNLGNAADVHDTGLELEMEMLRHIFWGSEAKLEQMA